jgi:hypothetical protein
VAAAQNSLQCKKCHLTECLTEVFESKMLSRIFGAQKKSMSGRWGKSHNKELHNLSYIVTFRLFFFCILLFVSVIYQTMYFQILINSHLWRRVSTLNTPSSGHGVMDMADLLQSANFYYTKNISIGTVCVWILYMIIDGVNNLSTL